MRTVGEHKTAVAGILTGIDLDSVTNVNGALARAARITAQKTDAPEAIGRQAITLYDGVFTYAISENIFGTSLMDFRPQGNSRTFLDFVYKQPIEMFDRTKHLLPNGYTLAVEYTKGTPLLRVATPKPSAKVILDSLKDDTGWTAAGSASGLTEDNTVYYESPASLRFTLTGSSTGTLTKTITSVDVSEYEDVSVIFLAMRIPDGATVSNLTNVVIRIGSSSTDYDEVTETDGFLGAWTAGDWLLTAFDLSASTSTGTPDWNAIDYVQLRFAHTATLTNFRVGALWMALPSPHEVIYQTAAVFMADATPSTQITDDDDTILFNDGVMAIYEYISAKEIALQMAGGEYTAQIKGFDETLNGQGDEPGLLKLFRADNPSEELRNVGSYYD